ncbi:MAG: phage tail assembly protein T [Bacillota bacterium]
MSSKELTEWMAFYTLNPFGEEREDLRTGIIASTIVNAIQSFGDSKNKKEYKPQDFMPEFYEEEEDKQNKLLSIVENLNKAFGGKDLRDKGDN